MPTWPCGGHLGKSGGGGIREEKVETCCWEWECNLALCVPGGNISLGWVKVAHCCCSLGLLCAELFLEQGS